MSFSGLVLAQRQARKDTQTHNKDEHKLQMFNDTRRATHAGLKLLLNILISLLEGVFLCRQKRTNRLNLWPNRCESRNLYSKQTWKSAAFCAHFQQL